MMTRFSTTLKVLAVGALFCLTTSPAWADFTSSHGHTGHVQNPANYNSAFAYDWGLDLRVKPFKTDWVHYGVPMAKETLVRHVGIRMYLNADYNVSEVRVRNGTSLVKTFKNLNLSRGWNTKMLDTGVSRSFDKGLGISMKLEGAYDVDDADIGRYPRVVIEHVGAFHGSYNRIGGSSLNSMATK